MNKLSLEKRVKVIRALVEGCSIRSTVRMTGVSKWAVTRLLVSVGKACMEYQDEHLRNLPCKIIQVDEIWTYAFCKQKNVPRKRKGKLGYGDAWVWVAIDPNTKLVASWLLGTREADYALAFMLDLKSRLANKIQLSSDGHPAYLSAVEEAFGGDVDYGMVVKIYGKPENPEEEFNLSECIAIEKKVITGKPDKKKISTSHVERQNLNMRMGMRRFTRRTNAFSKKIENLEAAIALHFQYYNFCRPHLTLNKERNLGVTPAMAARVAIKAWNIEEIVSLTE